MTHNCFDKGIEIELIEIARCGSPTHPHKALCLIIPASYSSAPYTLNVDSSPHDVKLPVPVRSSKSVKALVPRTLRSLSGPIRVTSPSAHRWFIFNNVPLTWFTSRIQTPHCHSFGVNPLLFRSPEQGERVVLRSTGLFDHISRRHPQV